MSLPTLRAAIFDFDGTLVDSMPLHFEAYRRALSEHGVDLSRPHFDASVGGTAAETIPKLLGGRGGAVDPGAIHARKKDIFGELIDDQPVPTLETAKLLGLLAGRVPLAVASSGSRDGVGRMIDRLGWTETFDVVVTGDDVVDGKPAPECFLIAAERLGVRAEDCLVFEDADAGLEAAAAAGMTAIDVRRAP